MFIINQSSINAIYQVSAICTYFANINIKCEAIYSQFTTIFKPNINATRQVLYTQVSDYHCQYQAQIKFDHYSIKI